jgi:hypothetical protein
VAHLIGLDEGPPIPKLGKPHKALGLGILEGDTGENCLHGLYITHQLTLHELRTNVSYEHWFTLSYTLFCFECP